MDILFQDEFLIAINKPAGLLTIRDGYNPDLPTVKSELEKDFGRLWIVHRLDKETSGVLLLARDEKSHRLLNIAFENHQIHKTYHALVSGIPPQTQFDISLPLKVNGDRKHRTVVDWKNGKPAKSSVRLLQAFENYSLLEIQPESGYTHQIRAHLFSSGFPLLGDQLYKLSDSPHLDTINRTALHAFQINFQHPINIEVVLLTAPYPLDFQLTINSLKK